MQIWQMKIIFWSSRSSNSVCLRVLVGTMFGSCWVYCPTRLNPIILQIPLWPEQSKLINLLMQHFKPPNCEVTQLCTSPSQHAAWNYTTTENTTVQTPYCAKDTLLLVKKNFDFQISLFFQQFLTKKQNKGFCFFASNK